MEFSPVPGPDHGLPWITRFRAHTSVTERERDVLSVLLNGSTVPDGARRLGLATSTVRMHVKNLHSKSGTNNLHSLAVWALIHYDCFGPASRDRHAPVPRAPACRVPEGTTILGASPLRAP